MSKRGKVDIMADVLRVAEHGNRKTRIMYSCNLSYRQLMGYLGLLQALGLLSENGGCFEATDKGVEYLQDYRKLQGHLVSVRGVGQT